MAETSTKETSAPMGQTANTNRPVRVYEEGEQKTLYFSLSPEAEVAVLARMLHREGYDDHNWGHITYVQPDGTILLNPWEVPWDEIRASDILRIDTTGKLLSGRWTVTPAVALHLAAHRLRPDVKVAVHHHSQWGTVWGALGEIPGIYNQNSAQVGELGLYNEYEADVTFKEIAELNVRAMGNSNAAILANHGVFILGDSIARAHQRCVALETRARMAWRVKALGAERGLPMTQPAVDGLVSAALGGKSGNRMYHAMIRREVLADPSVLT
ncbi:class II aldolase/adducin family protein [Noviherbaspirillum sedimenti]|uniref:Class II aldolase/adducin family protein n=1 Tax=Noviherbaspirillum sedimenti TaxID=2320865 RepID=A0A3A3FWW5_9BURK|nr:class II aldolase/adducin family protein [Noviherbaspirillum sedimenti]RJG00637.1 class II aldolase/adducin family protein [Noviherbaspirillum sedimenti]